MGQKSLPRHPHQPLYEDAKGTIRFRENRIVRYLLDHGGYDLNQLHRMSEAQSFSQDDWVQFSQLHGYSLNGWGQLSFVTNEDWDLVNAINEGESEKDAEIEILRAEVKRLNGIIAAIRDLVED